MFGSLIRRFADNLDALRGFVECIHPFLVNSHKEEMKSDPVAVIPMLLAMSQLDDKALPINEDVRTEMLKRFRGDVEIVPSLDGDAKSVSLKVTGPGGRLFSDKMEVLQKKSRHIDLLRHNALISLVTSVEWFVAQILRIYFQGFPDAAGIKAMSLTFEDLSKIGSIDDARHILIESKLENMLRGSVTEWLAVLKSTLGISMGYLEGEKDRLVEICQRRNLLVHNGGIVNKIYLSKVPESVRPSEVVGDEIPVDLEYLDDAISLFEKCFILIGLEIWKKIDDKSESRAKLAMELSFRQLKYQRWSVAEGISRFLSNDKKVADVYQLIGKVNYWQSMKWSGQFEQVRLEVESEDVSSRDARFVLAKASLLDDDDTFFDLLPKAIRHEQLSLDELREWPLFKVMREKERYVAMYPSLVEPDSTEP